MIDPQPSTDHDDETRLDNLSTDLRDFSSYEPEQQQRALQQTKWLTRAALRPIQELLERMLHSSHTTHDSTSAQLEAAIFAQMVQRFRINRRGSVESSTDLDRLLETLGPLYHQLGTESSTRHHLLGILSALRTPAALQQFAELVVDDPPRDDRGIDLAFMPLLQNEDYDPQDLFPRLLDGMNQAGIAAAILDLANDLSRRQRVAQHPATSKTTEMIQLLGGLVQRLGHLESDPDTLKQPATDLNRKVNESVALAVALCDAVAWLGEPSAIGKLYQAMQLGHRRLRVEAAAALVRLGEESARQELAQLAAEPSIRLRVLAYARELDMLDQIDAPFQSDQAHRESELALWLAHPNQMGIPPTEIELLHQCQQYWPGYDDSVDCYLFRFRYRFSHQTYENIGIAGPTTFAFSADLTDLEPADLYAAFAGWQASHEEIYELETDQLTPPLQTELARLKRRLQDRHFQDIDPKNLIVFFGQRALVARAKKGGVPGIAMVDSVDYYWYPAEDRPPAVSHREAICIYKGKKLLRTFNPS